MRYISVMQSKTVQKLLSERSRLVAELGTLSHILRGSWVERYSVCSRANCKCHGGERHGPRRYLVVNEGGRQRQKYVPNSCVDDALKGLAQYRRLQDIVDRLTQVNLALMKETSRGT
jgi:hypothetical protein